jgi:hypothetical protein
MDVRSWPPATGAENICPLRDAADKLQYNHVMAGIVQVGHRKPYGALIGDEFCSVQA